MLLFDFRCATGHIHEAFVETGTPTVQCPICGSVASRIIGSPRVVLDPVSGDFPSATMKWERTREQHMAWERRQSASKGDDWYTHRLK